MTTSGTADNLTVGENVGLYLSEHRLKPPAEIARIVAAMLEDVGLKGTEDKWAEIFKGSVQDINKLTEQGLADKTMTSDYKQMVEAMQAKDPEFAPEGVRLRLTAPLSQKITPA